MSKKQEKSLIITNVIITIFTIIIIYVVSYLMKDMEWWKLVLSLLAIIICSGILNSLNIAYHLRKNNCFEE